MDQWLSNLKAATFEVLETMFFLFPEDWQEEDLLVTPGPGLQAWIDLEGPHTYQLGLTLPEGLAHIMAVNFLGGAAETLSPILIADTVKEAVNMISGVFLKQLGDAPLLHPQIPQARWVDFPEPGTRPGVNRLLLTAGDAYLEVFLEE